jgi:FkbM family methyltransferase
VLTLEEYEKLSPRCQVTHEGIEVKYLTPSKLLKWRVDTLFTKEPDTLAWIAGFQPGEVLVDVGANVGMYTVWAAKTRGTQVYAFEPEAQNYGLLNRNLVHNGLGGKVKAFCLALSDRSGLGELHLATLEAGGSLHSFDERVDYNRAPMQPRFSQGCVSARLDDLVRDGAVPAPHHIKIDVDGFEPRVIAGAAQVVRSPHTKSLLIEVNHNIPDHRTMVAELNSLGFRHDPAQVARAERKDGPFKGCAEYVFRR